MAPRSSRNLKTKEVKIPHLMIANKKKMETWSLGGLFAVDWNGTYEKLVEELADQKVEGSSDFVLFCQMLNAILAPVRPEYFQHNLLSFYHYAWEAITNPTAPTPDWGDAIEKTVSRQIKALGVCNEATYIGPYLAHLYSHFHEMDVEEKDDSKKRKALIQTVSDSKTETEDEKEPTEEIPRTFCEGKASGSKPLAQKRTIDYNEWGIRLESLGYEILKLLRPFTWRLAM
ncbi:hypothetical protein R1flu_012959 [Riccia fluitans]|uniref:Uncharacterized protein n=1 Tax=Riccia fluitans TaxID=41844 RepID=A0ABD1ZC45_9MARC